MSRIPVKWLIRLAVFRKLGDLLASAAPAFESFSAALHHFSPRVLRESFRGWWGRRSSFSQHLLTNLLVGLGISVVLIFLHHSSNPWLLDFEDAGMDWMMQMHVGTAFSNKSVPIAWIDIDDHTYREWDEPLYTPRRKLQALIAFAADSRARAIVVDVDISGKSDDAESDRSLLEYLEQYAGRAGPPLVFARTFRNSLDASSGECSEVRTSFVENSDAVANSGNIFWASTLFNRDTDGVIRRWRLWEPACTGDHQPVVVPSIQLLIGAITDAAGKPAALAIRGLMGQINRFAPRHCGTGSPAPVADGCNSGAEDVPDVRVNGLVLDASPSHVQQRLVYSISSHRSAAGLLARDDSVTPLFIRHSAYPITEPGQEVDNTWLSGRVVIIGNSHRDARDIHATPIGEQAGALVLANAINSLIQFGQITPPSTWLKLLIEAFLILIMSLAFTRFNSFWGMLVSGGVIIAVLLPVSFVLFKYGVWLDFAIPLIAVQLHQMAAEFEESRGSDRNSDY